MTFESEWRARFERFARTYEDEAEVSGWSPSGLRRRVALFASLVPALGLPPDPVTLELGCGAGTYVRLLADLGHRVVGLDYSRPSLARARSADPDGKARYVAADAYALPFTGGAFDFVVSIGVLQALSQVEPALDEMVRTLRPGGFLLIEALNRDGLVDLARRASQGLFRLPGRVQTHSPQQMRQWLAARGLHLTRQQALCLPPRQLPRLARLLESASLAAALDASPRLALMVAHAWWFVARKSPSSRPGAR